MNKNNLSEQATDYPLVLFTSPDGEVTVQTRLEHDTVWLTQEQMAALFGRERSVITKHIRNAINEGEVDEHQVCANFAHTADDGKTYQVAFYNLDVIISVGYRVKSQRGVEFRRWVTGVLRDYLLRGCALNKRRLKELGQVVRILKRAEKQLEAPQVLAVIERYADALALLDDYDHQRIAKPSGRKSRAKLSYDECRRFIDAMRFGSESTLFGREKDESLKSCLGAIYQTFDGKDIYPSSEEKAANLLYFVIKNHAFIDGNKRIGAALFLYFLDKSRLLLTNSGEKRVADHTLVALTLMIAESKPAEHDLMVNLVMTFLTEDYHD